MLLIRFSPFFNNTIFHFAPFSSSKHDNLHKVIVFLWNIVYPRIRFEFFWQINHIAIIYIVSILSCISWTNAIANRSIMRLFRLKQRGEKIEHIFIGKVVSHINTLFLMADNWRYVKPNKVNKEINETKNYFLLNQLLPFLLVNK